MKVPEYGEVSELLRSGCRCGHGADDTPVVLVLLETPVNTTFVTLLDAIHFSSRLLTEGGK